jgi:hypothetical protein
MNAVFDHAVFRFIMSTVCVCVCVCFQPMTCFPQWNTCWHQEMPTNNLSTVQIRVIKINYKRSPINCSQLLLFHNIKLRWAGQLYMVNNFPPLWFPVTIRATFQQHTHVGFIDDEGQSGDQCAFPWVILRVDPILRRRALTCIVANLPNLAGNHIGLRMLQGFLDVSLWICLEIAKRTSIKLLTPGNAFHALNNATERYIFSLFPLIKHHIIIRFPQYLLLRDLRIKTF